MSRINAQPAYSLRIYQESDGILLNRIGNLTHHTSGMIWFTSGELVFSFDGRTFATHRYTNVGDSVPIRHGSAFIPVGKELLFNDDEHLFYVTENQQISNAGRFRGMIDFNSRRQPHELTNYLHEHRASTAMYSFSYLSANRKDGYILDLTQLRYYRHQAKAQKVVLTYPDNARGLLFDGDTCLLITLNKVYAIYKEQLINPNVTCISDGTLLDLASITKCFYANGRYYLCNKTGIHVISYQNGKLVGKKLIDSKDLPQQDAFTSILTIGDNETILLGTKSSGLYHFQRTWVKSYLSTNPLNASMNSLLDFRNKIYTNTRGVWSHDGKYEKWSPLFFEQYNNDYFRDNSGNIYADSARHLAVYDKFGHLLKVYPVRMDFSIYCSYKNGVLAITDTQSYWVTPDTIKRLKFSWPFNHLLMRNNYSVLEYADTLWVGSVHGISYYPTEKGSKPVSVGVLKGTSVRRIIREPNGRGFFVFTYGKGVFWYYKGRFLKAPLDEKGYLLFAHYLLFDEKGGIWIPTNDGILGTRYETWLKAIEAGVNKIFFYKIDRWDGIATAEFNGGTEHAAIKMPLKNGYYLSTVNGLVGFVPNNTKSLFPQSQIMIRSMATDFTPVADMQAPLSNFDVLKIYVSVPYLGNPENLVVEYRFANEGLTWKPVGKNGEIYYSRSGSGKKELEVRYRNGFGEVDFVTKRFTFYVNPLWYETWYARTLFVLAFFAVLVLLFRIREKQQKRKRDLLEQTIRERTHELHEALDDLTRSEENLRESDVMKEKVIRVLAHDIRSPLMSSIFLGTHVKNFVDRQNTTEGKETSDMMKEVITALHSMLDYSNDFLVWYNLNHENIKLHFYPCNLKELVDAVLKLYHMVIKTNNNTVEVNIPEDVIVHTDARLLQIVIRNLVDNANKYTDGGMIRVETAMEEGQLALIIANNGHPIAAEKYAEIQELFSVKEGKEAYPLTDHKFGLNLVSFLAKKLEIPVKFISTESGLTTITLFFSLKDDKPSKK